MERRNLYMLELGTPIYACISYHPRTSDVSGISNVNLTGVSRATMYVSSYQSSPRVLRSSYNVVTTYMLVNITIPSVDSLGCLVTYLTSLGNSIVPVVAVVSCYSGTRSRS